MPKRLSAACRSGSPERLSAARRVARCFSHASYMTTALGHCPKMRHAMMPHRANCQTATSPTNLQALQTWFKTCCAKRWCFLASETRVANAFVGCACARMDRGTSMGPLRLCEHGQPSKYGTNVWVIGRGCVQTMGRWTSTSTHCDDEALESPTGSSPTAFLPNTACATVSARCNALAEFSAAMRMISGTRFHAALEIKVSNESIGC